MPGKRALKENFNSRRFEIFLKRWRQEGQGVAERVQGVRLG